MTARLLAAQHVVMGTTNILQFALPEGWRMVEGHGAPEVDRWTEHRGCRWMSQGRASYRLVAPHPGQPGLVRAEVELQVRAEPLAGSHEHGMAINRGVTRRGLLPRREVPVAILTVACPATGRRLVLELSAGLRGGSPAAAPGDIESLLMALQTGLNCH